MLQIFPSKRKIIFQRNKNEKFIENELGNAIKEGNMDIIYHLNTWIVEEWEALSKNIETQKINIDICKEYLHYAGVSDKMETTPSGQDIIQCRDNSDLIPLHELFDQETKKRLNTMMIISFDRNACFLSKTSTLKFYSDERGANLIAELNQNSNQGTQIRPLIFNYGKVWCIFDAGASAIQPKFMVAEGTDTLKCSISLIPYEWTTCCVITENI